MNGLFKSMLWSAVNGPGLVDELQFATALGGGISAEFFAQPRYYEIENFWRVLVETDRRHEEHNRVPLAHLILITENRDGWLQKADVRVDSEVFAQIQNQLPSVLWIYFPAHHETVNVKVQKEN